MKNILKTILLIIISLACAILLYNNYTLQKQHEQTITANQRLRNYLSDSISNLQLIINKKGDSLYMARQSILSLNNAVELGIIEREDLKNRNIKQLESITSLKEEISILKIKGEYTAPVVTDSPCNCVQFPITSRFSDKWFYLSVTAYKDFPQIDSLFIRSEPVLKYGVRKDPGLKNIFQKSYPVVFYENNNPKITVTDIQHVKIEEEKAWYQTELFKDSAIGILGFIVGRKL
jgi:hypothetical protein